MILNCGNLILRTLFSKAFQWQLPKPHNKICDFWTLTMLLPCSSSINNVPRIMLYNGIPGNTVQHKVQNVCKQLVVCYRRRLIDEWFYKLVFCVHFYEDLLSQSLNKSFEDPLLAFRNVSHQTFHSWLWIDWYTSVLHPSRPTTVFRSVFFFFHFISLKNLKVIKNGTYRRHFSRLLIKINSFKRSQTADSFNGFPPSTQITTMQISIFIPS